MCNSVFTPYYSETVLYSMSELCIENEDGISILFYLQKIFPGTADILNFHFICKFLLFMNTFFIYYKHSYFSAPCFSGTQEDSCFLHLILPLSPKVNHSLL